MTNENLHHAACNVDLLSAPETIEALKMMTRFDNATAKIVASNRRARIRLLLEKHDHDPVRALESMKRAVERAESAAAEMPAAGKRAEADADAVQEATKAVTDALRRERMNLQSDAATTRAKAKSLEMKRQTNIKTLVDAGLAQADAESAAKPTEDEINALVKKADESIPARIAAIDASLADHTALVAAATESAAA
ncbi:MAG: hypothetical protein K9L88_07725 [Chromatiaceae bacterium]|nr:hypothetical protein [Chromatiaceae bacterium]